MATQQSILITGATGFIGRALATDLAWEGHRIVRYARSLGHDFNRLITTDAWLPHLDGIDVVINAVGIIAESKHQTFEKIHRHAPSALFRACETAKVKRVIQISALGADTDAITPYQLSKKAADDALRQLDLDWFVLRPSLIYGEGSRSLRLFRRLAMFPVLPLLDGGRQQIQPIHLNDLLATIRQCIESTSTKLTLDLVGPEAMSFAEWLSFLRSQTGKRPARIVDIPAPLLFSIAKLTRHLQPLLQPDNLRMLQQGNVATAHPLQDFLGRAPRDIRCIS